MKPRRFHIALAALSLGLIPLAVSAQTTCRFRDEKQAVEEFRRILGESEGKAPGSRSTPEEVRQLAISTSIDDRQLANLAIKDLDRRFDPHGFKHLKADSARGARDLSSGEAQYWFDDLAGIGRGALRDRLSQRVAALEQKALEDWEHGRTIASPSNHSKFYKIYDAGQVVGYNQGKPCHFIRVEWTSGTVHSHPLTDAEALKYLKN